MIMILSYIVLLSSSTSSASGGDYGSGVLESPIIGQDEVSWTTDDKQEEEEQQQQHYPGGRNSSNDIYESTWIEEDSSVDGMIIDDSEIKPKQLVYKELVYSGDGGIIIDAGYDESTTTEQQIEMTEYGGKGGKGGSMKGKKGKKDDYAHYGKGKKKDHHHHHGSKGKKKKSDKKKKDSKKDKKGDHNQAKGDQGTWKKARKYTTRPGKGKGKGSVDRDDKTNHPTTTYPITSPTTMSPIFVPALPTQQPRTNLPTTTPSAATIIRPTQQPTTQLPTRAPSNRRSEAPSSSPSYTSDIPTGGFSDSPSPVPSFVDNQIIENNTTETTVVPTNLPTANPPILTNLPTTTSPTGSSNPPSEVPSTGESTGGPSARANLPPDPRVITFPSAEPSEVSNVTPSPTGGPSQTPNLPLPEPDTPAPSNSVVTDAPTQVTTTAATGLPTDVPTDLPTVSPTDLPTGFPTLSPIRLATSPPTTTPTAAPLVPPSQSPSRSPSQTPTFPIPPTESPSMLPSDAPSGPVEYVQASPWCATYEVTNDATPTPEEFAAAADATCSHLGRYSIETFAGQFGSLVSFQGFQCAQSLTQEEPLEICFDGTLVVQEDSFFVPDREDVDLFLNLGLSRPDSEPLIETLNSFRNRNPFSSTTEVAYRTFDDASIAAGDISFKELSAQVQVPGYCITHEVADSTAPKEYQFLEATDFTCSYVLTYSMTMFEVLFGDLVSVLDFDCGLVSASVDPLQICYNTTISVEENSWYIPDQSDMESFAIAAITQPSYIANLRVLPSDNPFSSTTKVTYDKIITVQSSDATTPLPTADSVIVNATPWCVIYTTTDRSVPTSQDFTDAESLTCSHTLTYVLSTLISRFFPVDALYCERTSASLNPLEICFKGNVTIGENPTSILTEDIDGIISTALSDSSAVNELYTLLNGLSSSNPFSTTTAVYAESVMASTVTSDFLQSPSVVLATFFFVVLVAAAAACSRGSKTYRNLEFDVKHEETSTNRVEVYAETESLQEEKQEYTEMFGGLDYAEDSVSRTSESHRFVDGVSLTSEPQRLFDTQDDHDRFALSLQAQRFLDSEQQDHDRFALSLQS